MNMLNEWALIAKQRCWHWLVKHCHEVGVFQEPVLFLDELCLLCLQFWMAVYLSFQQTGFSYILTSHVQISYQRSTYDIICSHLVFAGVAFSRKDFWQPCDIRRWMSTSEFCDYVFGRFNSNKCEETSLRVCINIDSACAERMQPLNIPVHCLHSRIKL